MSETVSFFFDYTSPYTWLASTRVEGLAARTGATLVWRPAFLGAVMKATGNQPPATLPARAAYMLQDLQRHAELYGLPFSFPQSFPLPSLPALRVTASLLDRDREAGVRFVHRVFRAAWGEQADIGSVFGLAQFAVDVGLDPSVVSAAEEPRWKDAVRANTQAVVDAGAFGFPALVVGDELFFGNDRLDLLEERLRRGRPFSRADGSVRVGEI